MKKSFLILSISLLFAVSLAMAGITGKIAGSVTDAETGEPLVGANVVIEGTQLGTATGLDGYFFIIKVPPGKYTVRANMMGYGILQKTDVLVNIDRTTTINFGLKTQVIAGETITAVARRPIVERDLTASKERITSKEIANSWAYTVDEAISTQSGVNINNGIRGSFGLDVAYFVDGQELRESGSNSNFTGINTTAIAEMEVLTGGYNAEYGQANSGIVNIVTKTSKDKIRGTVKYRVRPAGKYHWGRNIFSKENYDWKVMGTLDYWTTHEGGAYADKTPGERLAAWKKFISGEMFNSKELRDYDKRIQHEIEATIYGPITSKLDFLLSGRYLKGVNKFPSALNYNPEYNFQAKLDYQLTSATNISFSGLYGGYETTGLSKTNYWSSEDSPQRARGLSAGQSPGASIQNPYEPYKYLYWIAGGRTGDGIRPPEYAKIYSGQLKLTHVFSPRTYVELKASHFVFNQEMNTLDHLKMKWGGPDWTWPEDKMPPANELFVTSGYGDFRFNYNDSKNSKIEGSLVSQIAPQHLLKMGTGFSYQYFKNIWHEGRSADRIYMSDYIRPIAFHPYEGYAYFQDKVEIKGMIVNAGLRFDFYNANKKVSNDFWDPLRIDKNTPGNRGMSLISFDPNGPYAVKTRTQTVLSPRLGVSFPITENTVLHFMYGHFNMRPAWMKMLADPIEKMEPPPEGVQVTAPIKEEELPIYHDYPTVYTGHQRNVGNPTLEFEKMIQYEVGFDQNIADLLRLDVTLYYKDGKNLTSVGYQKSGMGNMATSSWLATRLYPDDNNPESISVGDMGYNFVYTNGGALDVRGLEATLETKLWRNATFKIIYNMSYANTIRYGLDTVYRLFDDGTKLGRDYLWGASNFDQGVVGNTNQRWNPNNTIKFISYLSTPLRFGPKVNGFHPLGNWHLNVFTMYSSGEKFTYHSPDDFSSEPLNMTWKPRYMTNLKLIKRINGLGMGFEFSVDVRNVFNNKTLRLMGGKNLEDYMENGKLPTDPLTNEVMEWTMYRRDTMPREVFFGLGITF